MDGFLKIKTKLDNSGINKDTAELEKKIAKIQEDNAQSSSEQGILQQEIDDYEQLKQKANEYKQKIKDLKAEKEAMFKANPSLAVTADTPEYANVKAQITQMQQKYAQANMEVEKQAPKIEKVAMKLEKIKAKQSQNNAKIQEYKQKIEQINLDKVQRRTRQCGEKHTDTNRENRKDGDGNSRN